MKNITILSIFTLLLISKISFCQNNKKTVPLSGQNNLYTLIITPSNSAKNEFTLSLFGELQHPKIDTIVNLIYAPEVEIFFKRNQLDSFLFIKKGNEIINLLPTENAIEKLPLPDATTCLPLSKINTNDKNTYFLIGKDSTCIKTSPKIEVTFKIISDSTFTCKTGFNDALSLSIFSTAIIQLFEKFGVQEDLISQADKEEWYNWTLGYIKTQPLIKEERDTENAKAKLGELRLLKADCPIYVENNRKRKTSSSSDQVVKIASISTTIKDGYIFDTKVFTKDGREFDYLNIISLKDFIGEKVKRKCFQVTNINGQKLFKDNADSKNYILLSDVIQYKGKSGQFFPPEDTKEVLLNNDSLSGQKVDILQGISANQLLNISLFTDFYALADNQKNGLIETEGFFTHRLNTKPLCQTNIIFLHFFRIRMNARKFTDDNGIFRLDTINSEVNRVNLYQRTNFSWDATIGIINWRMLFKQIRTPHRLYLNFIYASNSVKTALKTDTVNTIPKNIILSNLGVQAGIILRFANNFSFQCNFNLFGQKISNATAWISNTKSRAFYSLDGLITYHFPDQHSTLFLRAIYTSPTLPHGNNTVFSQLQIGYNLDIADFIGKVKK